MSDRDSNLSPALRRQVPVRPQWPGRPASLESLISAGVIRFAARTFLRPFRRPPFTRAADGPTAARRLSVLLDALYPSSKYYE